MTSYGLIQTFLADEAATVDVGAKIGAGLTAGNVVFLEGELGAAKTTFTRGVLRARGHTGAVKSPTYTLCEPYDLGDTDLVCHLDLYRLSDPEELEFLGFRDYLASGAIVLIEWPSRGEGWLPNPDLKIELSETASGRVLCVSALTTSGSQVLKRCGVDHVE